MDEKEKFSRAIIPGYDKIDISRNLRIFKHISINNQQLTEKIREGRRSQKRPKS